MKKLNKAELEALAEKISKEMREANERFVDMQKTVNREQNISARDQIMYELNNMLPIMNDYITEKIGYGAKDYKKAANVLRYVENKMIESMTLPYVCESGYHYKQTIINELILAQIEAESLDDLVTKASKAFKGA